MRDVNIPEDEAVRALAKERLDNIKVIMSEEDFDIYMRQPDVLEGEFEVSVIAPVGYKRCGGCKRIKKLHLFNKSNGTKLGVTGNCKECQKQAAKVSYENNKDKIDHAEVYQRNKATKQRCSKAYYDKNKDTLKSKHKDYTSSSRGKQVMKRAHKKRKNLMLKNRGIHYKREWIIDRDKQGGAHPICYLCNLPITGPLHLDHVVPVALGGKDCFTNIAATHELCNLRRTKDATELAVDLVEQVYHRAVAYIDVHPELFEEEDAK